MYLHGTRHLSTLVPVSPTGDPQICTPESPDCSLSAGCLIVHVLCFFELFGLPISTHLCSCPTVVFSCLSVLFLSIYVLYIVLSFS
jgi:hypothetical protein